jgi:hypothetical protein
MNTVDEAHIDENTRQIDFLIDIIKANKLHEPDCVAFSLPKDHSGPFGFTASMAYGHCHCWLDKDNRAEDGHAFTWYHLTNTELGKTGYVNRYGTVKALLESNEYLSRNRSDANYWGKSYAIVEVTLQPTESSE